MGPKPRMVRSGAPSPREMPHVRAPTRPCTRRCRRIHPRRRSLADRRAAGLRGHEPQAAERHARRRIGAGQRRLPDRVLRGGRRPPDPVEPPARARAGTVRRGTLPRRRQMDRLAGARAGRRAGIGPVHRRARVRRPRGCLPGARAPRRRPQLACRCDQHHRRALRRHRPPPLGSSKRRTQVYVARGLGCRRDDERLVEERGQAELLPCAGADRSPHRRVQRPLAGLRRHHASHLQLPRQEQRLVRRRVPVPHRRPWHGLRGPQLRAHEQVVSVRRG